MTAWTFRFEYGSLKLGEVTIKSRREKTALLEKGEWHTGFRTTLPVTELYETEVACKTAAAAQIRAAIAQSMATERKLRELLATVTS